MSNVKIAGEKKIQWHTFFLRYQHVLYFVVCLNRVGGICISFCIDFVYMLWYQNMSFVCTFSFMYNFMLA